MMEHESKKTFEHLLFICPGTCASPRFSGVGKYANLTWKSHDGKKERKKKTQWLSWSFQLWPQIRKPSGQLLQWKVARTLHRLGRGDLQSQIAKRLISAKLLKHRRIDLRDPRVRGIWTPSVGSGIAQRHAWGVRKEESERLLRPRQIKISGGRTCF